VKHVRFRFPKMFCSDYVNYWLILLLAFSLVLVACERTIPTPDEPVVDVLPPVDPITEEDPFALPDRDPAPTDGYPPPEEDVDLLPRDDEPPVEEEPASEPEEPEEAEPEPVLQPGGTYTVQAGDTLFSIAQRYGITVEALARANNITNVNRLDIGQVLTIPAEGDMPASDDPGEERIHVVQRGETFYRIALNYGFTVEELASYNNIADPTRIDVGQQIRIPARQNG
jgi:LysM repeat protein